MYIMYMYMQVVAIVFEGQVECCLPTCYRPALKARKNEVHCRPVQVHVYTVHAFFPMVYILFWGKLELFGANSTIHV